MYVIFYGWIVNGHSDEHLDVEFTMVFFFLIQLLHSIVRSKRVLLSSTVPHPVETAILKGLQIRSGP